MRLVLKMRKRTPPQKRISQSLKRFNMGVWGRQSGKTTYGLDKLIWKPLQGRKNAIYWYLLQTHSAATTAMNRYLRLIRDTPLFRHKNESEKWVQLSNGSTIFFKSGHNFEDLRMETLDGAIIDELRQQHPDLWPMIIRPMLARRKSWCDFLTTPNGFDHSKDLYDYALQNPQEWAVFHAPSTEAWWWTEQEIESAKSTMSDDVYAQEILAEFREIGAGKAYKNHSILNQRIDNPFAVKGYEYSPYLPIIVGLDFNTGLCVWEIMQHKAGAFHAIDEIALEHTDTEQMTTVLSQRILDFYSVLPPGPKPGVVLIGDASGNAKRSSAVGQTDYSIIKKILKENNIQFEDLTPKENPGVKDRVNLMNSVLKSANGTVHFTYNPIKCKYLKRDFERVKWKQGADGAFLDKSDLLATHASDAAGYPVCHYNHIFRDRPGTLRVIPR
jgi:hypothetical protein